MFELGLGDLGVKISVIDLSGFWSACERKGTSRGHAFSETLLIRGSACKLEYIRKVKPC